MPRSFPSLLLERAFMQTYIGPPAVSPFSFFPLYLTESMLSTSLVARPMMLVTTIQNSAPGPPSTIAVATPTMLPMPRVVASSVVSAEKDDIFPSPPLPLSPPNAHFSAHFRFFSGKNLRRAMR